MSHADVMDATVYALAAIIILIGVCSLVWGGNEMRGSGDQ